MGLPEIIKEVEVEARAQLKHTSMGTRSDLIRLLHQWEEADAEETLARLYPESEKYGPRWVRRNLLILAGMTLAAIARLDLQAISAETAATPASTIPSAGAADSSAPEPRSASASASPSGPPPESGGDAPGRAGPGGHPGTQELAAPRERVHAG